MVAERVGLLKLNGRLRGYPPLSRVLELEGLVMVLNGRPMLGESLRNMARSEPRLAPVDFARLLRRAQEQLAETRKHHADAAGAVFRRAG